MCERAVGIIDSKILFYKDKIKYCKKMIEKFERQESISICHKIINDSNHKIKVLEQVLKEILIRP